MARDLGLLILRAGAGLMLASHGFGKWMNIVQGKLQFPDPIGIGPVPSLIGAALAEFVCALLVVVGYKARWAAVPAAFSMLVAGIVFHWSDPFAEKEKALLFAVAFLAIALLGPGRFSLDRK
jgi:putative oxidoreductase